MFIFVKHALIVLWSTLNAQKVRVIYRMIEFSKWMFIIYSKFPEVRRNSPLVAHN